MYRWAAITALLVFTVAACGGDDDDSTPTPDPTDEPTAEPTSEPTEIPSADFDEGPCPFDPPAGEDVQCGTLTVPEDRDDPDSSDIELAVAVFQARDANPEPDPIVYLEGGPGGDALEILQFTFDAVADPFLDERDFIVFDQRGAGFSEPALECDELNAVETEALETGPTEEQYSEAALVAIEECRADLVDDGIDPALANSAESAADVEALRVALGYDEWNLYGISYGTRLALTVLRDYPDGVRSVILDSVFPPEEAAIPTLAQNFDRALNVLFDDCAADEECVEEHPDLRNLLFETVDRLNEERPVAESLLGGILGPSDLDEIVLTGDLFLRLLFQSLYSAELIPTLPDLIQEVSEEDYELAALLAATFLQQQEFVTNGMYFSVQCSEDTPFISLEDAEAALAEYPDLRDAFTGEPEISLEVCEIWDAEPPADRENEPVESDVPALVLAGAYDPITPPEWGQQTADRLDTAYYFEFPAQGHAASAGNDCAAEVMLEFLEAPDSQPDATCTETLDPPDFGGIPFF